MLPKVLITGATSGIGAALAGRYAGRAELLLTGRRPAGSLVHALPQGARYVEADQSVPETAADRIAAAMTRCNWTALDLAILNAGMGKAGDPALEQTSTIRETLDVNLSATIALALRLHAPLATARGTLVLVGSTARRGAPAFASYAAAKAGLDGLGRALAEEWRGRVAVRIIHPGPVATDIHAKAGHDPGRARRVFASPEAMARMIERAVSRRRARLTISFPHYLADAATPWRR